MKALDIRTKAMNRVYDLTEDSAEKLVDDHLRADLENRVSDIVCELVDLEVSEDLETKAGALYPWDED